MYYLFSDGTKIADDAEAFEHYCQTGIKPELIVGNIYDDCDDEIEYIESDLTDEMYEFIREAIDLDSIAF